MCPFFTRGKLAPPVVIQKQPLKNALEPVIKIKHVVLYVAYKHKKI